MTDRDDPHWDRECGEPYVSPVDPDWLREAKPSGAWIPSRALLACLREHEKWSSSRSPLTWLRLKLCVLRHRFWSAVSGADIPLGTKIGGGLLLPHPNGVVIHPEVVIGANCLIFQQVTLGARGLRPGAPKVGGHVDIGAGAKILGPVVIGDHAKIGANAVVLCDVPAGCIAMGVPAQIVRRGLRASFASPQGATE